MVVDKFENAETILRVSHLKQYFKLGEGKLKAVHDVTFEVRKGEVFGIVGESGCGKTTTGRSIIKLYDITSGNVHFQGHRIAAGTRWNEKEIKYTRIRGNAEIKRLHKECLDLYNEFEHANSDDVDACKAEKIRLHNEYNIKIQHVREHIKAVVEEQTAIIKKAKFDHKYCDKIYQNEQIAKCNEKFLPLLDAAKAKAQSGNEEDIKAYKELKGQYKSELRIAKHDKLVTKIQMIYQDPIACLDPRMTVREIISEGLVIKGVRDQEYITKRVNEALETVGLVPEHASRYPHEFSGGQRQRIGIARALIMDPELIIADEPISALDVSIKAQVINLLDDLRHKLGLTIIFIAHDLSVVKYFCDRIAVMYFGNMVELTTSEELFKHPLHPYTKSLLSAIPYPDPHYEKHRVRITYNPVVAHDYSVQKPSFREVIPGHFVSCNDDEEQRYLKEIEAIDSKKD